MNYNDTMKALCDSILVPVLRTDSTELADKAIPRSGYEVYADGKVIGHVTTGYNSISTGKSVCMALIDSAHAALGTEVEIHIRKKFFKGTVVKKRFYEKNYKK